jgi:flagellar basal-body rod modification protein FlgD
MVNRVGLGGSVSASGTAAAVAAGGVPSTDGTEDRFMKLLVAQMRNQDPLNPLDNAQVTSQLAQINTVRGIDEMNQSLKKLLQRDQGFNPADAAALVGRQIWVEGARLDLGPDATARGGFELPAAARSVMLEIVDARGAVVDRVDLGAKAAGMHVFEWDGQTADRTAPAGRYSVRLEARDGAQVLEAVPMNAARVKSVLRGAGGVALELDGGRSVGMDALRGVL